MKIRLLIVFLLAGLVGFAQTNTDPLDASKVKKLKLLQSSPQDAIAEFGTPAKKDVKNERQKYTFRAKNSVLILEFNKDNALSAYNLTKNFPAAKAHLAGNDVKKINAGATTPDEITKLFGEMTQQVINSREEKWYFGQGSSYLEVDFPSDNPGKVSKF
ncbi:MAG: hypothetical protein Q8867_11000, partial [Bacteroidota bacterium]|nr:hypothetical protein [Bacteroidota bacterium]